MPRGECLQPRRPLAAARPSRPHQTPIAPLTLPSSPPQGTTITLPAFTADFGLDTKSTKIKADIVSFFQAGALVGAVAGYPAMEIFGRKASIMATSLIFIVGAILAVAATDQLGLIYASRVIDGFAVGGIT